MSKEEKDRQRQVLFTEENYLKEKMKDGKNMKYCKWGWWKEGKNIREEVR